MYEAQEEALQYHSIISVLTLLEYDIIAASYYWCTVNATDPATLC